MDTATRDEVFEYDGSWEHFYEVRRRLTTDSISVVAYSAIPGLLIPVAQWGGLREPIHAWFVNNRTGEHEAHIAPGTFIT